MLLLMARLLSVLSLRQVEAAALLRLHLQPDFDQPHSVEEVVRERPLAEDVLSGGGSWEDVGLGFETPAATA
jgi:hypothetical protein